MHRFHRPHTSFVARNDTNALYTVVLPEYNTNMHHLLLPEYSRPIAITAFATQKRRDKIRLVDSKLSNDQQVITHSTSKTSTCTCTNSTIDDIFDNKKRKSLIRQLRDALTYERQQIACQSPAFPPLSSSSPVSVCLLPTMIVESLQTAILTSPDCSNENFHPVPQLSDTQPCLPRPKRVTFAAELNLRRRSARQSLLGLTVDEIDALGRLDGGGVQRPLTTIETLTKRPIVGILRKKEYSMEQLNMELEIMRNTCIDETLDCQNNQRLLHELELYIASFKEPTKPLNQVVNCKARQRLQESLKELKKKERKYDQKIVILQQTTNKVRVLNKNFRREIANICAPLKKS
jgi:hypothetical protein